jgi:hypothetical protein
MGSVINIDLEPLGGGSGVELTPARQALEDQGYYEEVEGQPSPVQSVPAQISGAYAEGESKYLPDTPRAAPKPTPKQEKRTVIFDTETTGVDFFKSKWLVATFWLLGTPKSEMVTFAGFDEEENIRAAAAWLNDVQPERMVAYNVTFDRQFMYARMAAHHVPCPAFFSCEFFDMMDINSKGGEKYSKPGTKAGTVEEWGSYLFGEGKPYTVDDMFAGVEAGDLTPMIIRNRYDVGIEGDMYLTYQFLATGDDGGAGTLRPPVAELDTGDYASRLMMQCPVCNTMQLCLGRGVAMECFVCGEPLDCQLNKSDAWKDLNVHVPAAKKASSTTKKA